ncbi:MAG TPA: hypothetical protein VFU04_09515, partial [Solirubrobacterales bacterium]|nr:hypothetical protein [Solirubrobacterales bacterium]
MRLLQIVGEGLVPPRCAACGRGCRSGATLCTRCGRRLAFAQPIDGLGPAGIDRAWSTAAHEGVPRDLVAALKFRRLLPVAETMAERIHWLAPASLLSGAIVPVPTARLRTWSRGFDPAREIGAALARRTGLPLEECLHRRGAGRQRGRRRHERIGHPPRVLVCAPVPRSVL